jgi:hypothetical protein
VNANAFDGLTTMSSKKRVRWLRIGSVVLVATFLPLAVFVAGQIVGAPSEALESYRTARAFMEALQVQDEAGICRARRFVQEMPQCSRRVKGWFRGGELSEVRSYSLRSIRNLGRDPYFSSSVRFQVSPPWLGQPNGITLIVVKEHGQLVVDHFYPPDI